MDGRNLRIRSFGQYLRHRAGLPGRILGDSELSPNQEVGRQIDPFRGAAVWTVGVAPSTWGDQLRGAYGTHGDANPCQTPTDAAYRCLSVVPCQVVN